MAVEVLLVEDNADDALLLRAMFRKEKLGSFALVHVVRLTEALEHLEKNKVDIVLLDLGLPDGHGLDTLRRTLAAAPVVPVIVLTGLEDEVLAAEAMKEGALDYLIKGQIENRALPRVLRHAIERHRMQSETELLRAQQLQFKDDFLSHVSHELRSPLTAIYQFTTILLDGLAGDLNPEQSEHLSIVLTNVKQLRSMIDDLLEVTRLEAGKLQIDLQRTAIAEAIDYTLNTLGVTALAKGITLSADVHGGLPLICADPTRLRQILIILVDNAIKFTPAGGTVKVAVHPREDFPGFLVLKVTDSGQGIKPEMTERIFERLFQATDSALAGRAGLGLGLFICKELVTRQGGTIWATGTPGQGAVFSVTVPVYSLPTLIAPALRGMRHTFGPMTLMVAELGSQTGWASDRLRTEHSHVVRGLIQGCLHSDLDLLLPRMGSTGATEIFFVVVLTDAVGSEAIAERVREQLTGSQYIQRAGLTISAAHQPLDLIRQKANESMPDLLERLGIHIQEKIDAELAARLAIDE
jgi:signal transduction histidine kinase